MTDGSMSGSARHLPPRVAPWWRAWG